MCGRFALSARTDEIEKLVPGLKINQEIKARYNIAPTQDIPLVLNDADRHFIYARWGLVPSWAKDISIGSRLINARAETLPEKPAFKNSLRKKRCVVFADGFYEWRKNPGDKRGTPFFIRLKSGEPFTFAGLWDTWHDTESQKIIYTATLITTEPNELMSKIHDRMPAILLPQHRNLWLTDDLVDPVKLKEFLNPYPDGEMEAYEVSTKVNSPSVDSPELIKPL